MEGDRVSNAGSEIAGMSDFQREVQWRLALYGTDPPADVISTVLAEATRLRVAELQQRSGGATSPQVAIVRDKKKLPYAAFKTFAEGDGDIDGFLQDFERQCVLQGIDTKDWVPILASKLTGRAAEAFRAVDDEDCTVYERVKEQLLARYALTPEAYRVKFRSLRKGDKDTYTEWGHRLHCAVKSWIQGCQATTAEDVTQLFLLEQFYNYISPEVRDWVRDRKPLTLAEGTRLADEFHDARRSTSATASPPTSVTASPLTSVTAPSPPCVTPALTQPAGTLGGAPRYTSAAKPHRIGPRCYGCNQVGHIRVRCPKNQNRQLPARLSPNPAQASAFCLQRAPDHKTSAPAAWRDTGPIEEDLGILHEVNPVEAATADNRRHHQQMVHLNGRTAQGLRDTGATLTLVQPHLVPSPAKTGHFVAVRVAGGHVHRIPTARVHLDWGAGARDVEIGLMKGLPADVLLGNDLGLLTSTFVPVTREEASSITINQQAQEAHQPLFKGTQMPLCWGWERC